MKQNRHSLGLTAIAAALLLSSFLVTATDALAAGMVDRVETLEQAIGRMRTEPSPSGARATADLRRRALAFK